MALPPFERVFLMSAVLSHQMSRSSKPRKQASTVLESLSTRERVVLSQLADGKSYAQIAASLALSYKAVAHICSRLKPKLGVRSLVELVHFAVQNLPATPTHTPHPIRNGRHRTSD